MRIAGLGLFLFFLSFFNPVHAQPAAYERCVACHSGKDATKDLGPNLAGVFGRKAGSREDFRYSRSLSRSGVDTRCKRLQRFVYKGIGPVRRGSQGVVWPAKG